MVLDRTDDFVQALELLVSQAVFVGVPSTAPAREPIPGEPTPPNNAVIGYTMETGEPDRNIPARPFLVPAIKESQDAIVERLKAVSKAAFDAKPGLVNSLRAQLGLFSQRAVREKINTGPFQPLADATIAARANRSTQGAAGSRKGARKEMARRAQGLAASSDYARPLIDTGQLRNSINYVIGPTRNKKNKGFRQSGGYVIFYNDSRK